MSKHKPGYSYIHFANWTVHETYKEPVVVLVTWWEPEMGTDVFVYDDAEEALKAMSLPEWNQQWMTELDDKWEVHDDVVIRVMAF